MCLIISEQYNNTLNNLQQEVDNLQDQGELDGVIDIPNTEESAGIYINSMYYSN